MSAPRESAAAKAAEGAPGASGAHRPGRPFRLLLLALGGAAIAAAFLAPAAWPLAWLGLAPLFAFSPSATTRREAFVDGLASGLATNVPAFFWLVRTIHRFGGFPLPIALLFYLVLSLFGALQFGLVAIVLRRAGPRASLLIAPAAWTASEFLFPNLFPWRLAHSQRDLLPLLQVGEIAGPYALSFAMTWLAAALVRTPLSLQRIGAPLGAVAALGAWGAWRIALVDAEVSRATPFSIGIVQGNVGLAEKRHADRFEDNVGRYRRLSLALSPTPDLIVWPETVVEWGLPRDVDPPRDLDAFPGAPAPLLFGAISWSRRKGDPVWYNSAFLRGTDGSLRGAYDKIVLMPFGEFIPFASVWPWLKSLSPATGDFAAGSGPGILEVARGARIGPLICYEDLLSGHVRATVDAGATLLATLANDAWFGNTPALRQHEMLASWRAVENRRYLVRATNTGLTSVIDPVGRTAASLPVEEEAGVVVETRLLDGTTPYRRIGDLFAWATVLATAWLARANGARPGYPPNAAQGASRRPDPRPRRA